MIYKPSSHLLKVAYSYDMIVNSIDKYYGLKEIKNISNIKQKYIIKNYKDFYIDGNKIDLFDEKYQNNIVKNLSGLYKKGYLYYKNKGVKKRIKLYFANKTKKPKDGKNITISSGHLINYKGKVQIKLYSSKDFY